MTQTSEYNKRAGGPGESQNQALLFRKGSIKCKKEWVGLRILLLEIECFEIFRNELNSNN